MIFTSDTVLYHPVEGAKRVPQGEQHPGAMWSASPNGPGPDFNALNAALKEALSAANADKERLQMAVERSDASLAILAGERDKLASRVAGLEQDALAARKEAGDAKAIAESLTRERDQARQEAASLRIKIARLDSDGDGSPGGSLPEVDDPDAAEKAELRAQLAAAGISAHHRTGVAKLREMASEAKVAA